MYCVKYGKLNVNIKGKMCEVKRYLKTKKATSGNATYDTE